MALLTNFTGSPIANVSLSAAAPRIPVRINYDFFFNRDTVRNALDKATHQALVKGGLAVMQIARRSIKRRGLANEKLQKLRKGSEGVRTFELLERERTSGDKKRARWANKVITEIRTKTPSVAPNPPFTHLGNLRDKPGIVFAWDPISTSVVIGQSARGISWLASLHEFGGTEEQQAWAFVPPKSRPWKFGILGWWRVGNRPRVVSRWEPTQMRRTAPYPARPYMRPAIDRAVATRDILKPFANRFRIGGL